MKGYNGLMRIKGKSNAEFKEEITTIDSNGFSNP